MVLFCSTTLAPLIRRDNCGLAQEELQMTLTHPGGEAEALAANARPTPEHPYTEADLGRTEIKRNYRADLRPTHTPDVFYDANPVPSWKDLSWSKIGRPYRVERWSKEKKQW